MKQWWYVQADWMKSDDDIDVYQSYSWQWVTYCSRCEFIGPAQKKQRDISILNIARFVMFTFEWQLTKR